MAQAVLPCQLPAASRNVDKEHCYWVAEIQWSKWPSLRSLSTREATLTSIPQ